WVHDGDAGEGRRRQEPVGSDLVRAHAAARRPEDRIRRLGDVEEGLRAAGRSSRSGWNGLALTARACGEQNDAGRGEKPGAGSRKNAHRRGGISEGSEAVEAIRRHVAIVKQSTVRALPRQARSETRRATSRSEPTRAAPRGGASSATSPAPRTIQAAFQPAACAPRTSSCSESPTWRRRSGGVPPSARAAASKAARAGFAARASLDTTTART